MKKSTKRGELCYRIRGGCWRGTRQVQGVSEEIPELSVKKVRRGQRVEKRGTWETRRTGKGTGREEKTHTAIK